MFLPRLELGELIGPRLKWTLALVFPQTATLRSPEAALQRPTSEKRVLAATGR
jgi:hypothetical protein